MNFNQLFIQDLPGRLWYFSLCDFTFDPSLPRPSIGICCVCCHLGIAAKSYMHIKSSAWENHYIWDIWKSPLQEIVLQQILLRSFIKWIVLIHWLKMKTQWCMCFHPAAETFRGVIGNSLLENLGQNQWCFQLSRNCCCPCKLPSVTLRKALKTEE